MGELARYRLFLSFLAVPVVVVILIVVLLVNAFGGDEEGASPGEQQTAVAQVEPTLDISVVTVAPAQSSPQANATVTPTSTPLAIASSTDTPVPPPVESTPTAAAAATPASAPDGAPQEYEVQPNDTLSEIANSFGLTSAELAEANNIENPDEIQVGDILIIPAAAAGGERTPAATPTPTPIPISATVDPDEGLNVREEPTTDSDVLEVLLGGAEILLTGTRQTIDDIEWVELADGGWVQSQYLTIEGE